VRHDARVIAAYLGRGEPETPRGATPVGPEASGA
jgi:hypothetical protein